jgi:UDP-2-acetamido-2,6-beta-L-arabino-hexul-4-ose reductase
VKVLVTGANGFIGSNLAAQLPLRGDYAVLRVDRRSTPDDLARAIGEADFLLHMAGVNRPDVESEFARVNTELTRTLCEAVRASGRRIPIIFASSVHVERGNAYGASKLAAEQVLLDHSRATNTPVYIYRLSHVIGKWCRPDYNSVVATFCHNIARDRPIHIDDPAYLLHVVYIDDLVTSFVRIMAGEGPVGPFCEVQPSYPITVGELAAQLRAFHESRHSLVTERVGSGLTRALYATYVSYLPPEEFNYAVPKHGDARGVFVEMLRTKDSGQVSFFTAHPGVTRGSHYHHSKSEKFLVITGHARFRFRHIVTNETYEKETKGETPEIVETVPGWIHDITNVGDGEMIVMLWANEIFDRDNPDTYPGTP